MRRTLAAVLLLACIVTMTASTQAQAVKENSPAPQNITTAAVPVVEIDLATTPIVRPTFALHAMGSKERNAFLSQYGFSPPDPGFGYGFNEDPNPAYKKAFPFPEIILESLFPDAIFNVQSNQLGLKRVRAITRSWVLAPNTNPREVEHVVWAWDVPEPLRKLCYSEANSDAKNRDWVLCLYSPTETKVPAIPVEPQLFYFDAQSGLKWQTTLPLSQIVASIPLARDGYFASRDIQLGITSDGSRILALITCPERHMTLLCVFDGKGTLLKTSQFEGCSALATSTLPWQLMRSTSGQTHVIGLRHQFDNRGDVSLLVNRDGDVITRFENEEGKTVQILAVNDKFAFVQNVEAGHVKNYIIPLP
jgi:hypothetical protein